MAIYFDCAGACFPAAGLASLSEETRTIALATRALVHCAEAHAVTMNFTHVHSHQGHGLNELADNVAKAGADCLHCSGLPYLLNQAWYSPTSGVPEWAWMMHLFSSTKTQYGVPPVAGNVIPFPMATMPCMHALADIIAPPTILNTYF